MKNDTSVIPAPDATPAECPPRQLQPAAQQLLTASEAERLQLIYTDKFVLHDQARVILGRLKDGLARPRCERPVGYAILGDSDAGKTATVNRFVRDLGGDPFELVGVHDRQPLLVTEMPARADEPRIGLMLARHLRIPIVAKSRSRDVSDIILQQLRLKQTRMIIFQEFNNVKPIPKPERAIVADFLKNLNNNGIVVVVVGTEDAIDLIAEEEELTTRLKPLHLHGFRPDKEFGNFLATLETFYPFPQPSNLAQYARAIHRRTWGVMGGVVELVNDAAAWAVENRRPLIDSEAFTNCRYILPAAGPKGSINSAQ